VKIGPVGTEIALLRVKKNKKHIALSATFADRAKKIKKKLEMRGKA